MKLALYKGMHTTLPLQFHQFREDDSTSEFVRITEVVEVDFPPLPPEVTVPAELAKIDAAEAELREKFQRALDGLTTRRANLRALTCEVAT